MSKIQARVPDDLADRVEQAAKADGRSVSNWVRLVLERELDGRAWSEAVAPLVDAEPKVIPAVSDLLAEPSVLESPTNGARGCSHPQTVKRDTTFGVRRFCADPECGALL